MEVQNVDFSIEDVLNMHRQWITKLYVEEAKTDIEIVQMLHERQFIVTLSQIRRRIEEWGLVPLETPTALPVAPEISLEEDWEWVPLPRASPTPSHVSYTPSNADMMDLYSKKALPSIPSSTSPNKSVGRGKKRKVPPTDRLKVTCYHGPLPSEAHEAETTLSQIPEGPTPLDTYKDDKQSHEILALGLEMDELPRLGGYRRAGQPMPIGNPMSRRVATIRVRTALVTRQWSRDKPAASVQEEQVPERDSASPDL